MKFMNYFAWLCVVGMASGSVYADFDLVKEGQSKYVIQIAGSAFASEAMAAKELQTHVEKMTGCTLPIVVDVPEGRKAILVGDSEAARNVLKGIDFSALRDDEIILKTEGDTLVLAGDAPRGTLYAVYTLLEDTFGVRWWNQHETDFPETTTLTVPELDVRYAPPFFSREPYYKPFVDSPEFAARSKVNGHWEIIPDALGGHHDLMGWCHTFERYIPPEKYFEKHPEYFGETFGKREPLIQLCLTNQEMKAEFIRNVMTALAEKPGQRVIDISQNDHPTYCDCENCRKRVAELGNQTDLLLEFVNDVAVAIEEKYPDLTVMTLAYQYSRTPPKTVKPHHNVCIRLCSIEANFGRPLESEGNGSFGNDIREWSKLASQLAIWNYITNFCSYMIPHPNLRSLGKDIRFFRDNHAVSVFDQGDIGSAEAGDFTEMRCYLVSRLLWNPDLDETQLMKEFIDGYYGPAAPMIHDYWELLLNEYDKSGVPLLCYMDDTSSWLSNGTLMRAMKLMDEAEKAVASEQKFARRVAAARLSIDFAVLKLFSLGKEESLVKEFPEWTNEKADRLFDRALQVALENGMVHQREGQSYTVFVDQFKHRPGLSRMSPDELAKLRANPEQYPDRIRRANVSALELHKPGEWVMTVKDALAPEGKAVIMPGNHNQWAVQFHQSNYCQPGRWEVFALVRRTDANVTGRIYGGVFDEQTGANRASWHPVDTLPTDEYGLLSLGGCSLEGNGYSYLAGPSFEGIQIGGFLFIRLEDQK